MTTTPPIASPSSSAHTVAQGATATVGVVMGSNSDWDTMQHAVQILQQFGIAYEARVVSAHRMPP